MHDSLCKDSNVFKELWYFLLDQLIELENTDDLSGKVFNYYLIFDNLSQIRYPFRCCPGYIFRTSCLHFLYYIKHKPSCLEECGKAKIYCFKWKCIFHACVQVRRKHELENKLLLTKPAWGICTLFFENILSGNTDLRDIGRKRKIFGN